MKLRNNKTGFSLLEVTVVIGIMVLMTGIAIPAIKAIYASFQGSGEAITVISTAMAGARATAAKEQRYAGIRFQQDINGDQYIIFIVHSPDKTNLSDGFRAVEGQKPIKLAEGFLVTDMRVRTNHGTSSAGAEDTLDGPVKAAYLDNGNSANLGSDGYNYYLTDMTCFSIIFSPNGNLIIFDVRTRNKNGIFRPDNTTSAKTSKDNIFNSPESIRNNGTGMFIQDDYAHLGLGAESSRNMFVIFDKNRFDKLDSQKKMDYLNSLEPVYINPYTGTIISR
jgi:type II secretory pathway pseudopilin PulG